MATEATAADSGIRNFENDMFQYRSAPKPDLRLVYTIPSGLTDGVDRVILLELGTSEFPRNMVTGLYGTGREPIPHHYWCTNCRSATTRGSELPVGFTTKIAFSFFSVGPLAVVSSTLSMIRSRE